METTAKQAESTRIKRFETWMNTISSHHSDILYKKTFHSFVTVLLNYKEKAFVDMMWQNDIRIGH